MPEQSSKVASHIFERCSELCDMALKAELDVLAHLLSMAMLQAAKHLPDDGTDGGHPATRRK